MPIYEYLCPKCEKVIEIYRPTFACQIPACPDCLVPTDLKPSRPELRGDGWFHWFKQSDYGKAKR